MAALYGRLQGNRGQVTRMGHATIESKLETWDGSIKTVLCKDGDFQVYVGDKSYPNRLVISGNVNDGERHANPTGQLMQVAK